VTWGTGDQAELVSAGAQLVITVLRPYRMPFATFSTACGWYSAGRGLDQADERARIGQHLDADPEDVRQQDRRARRHAAGCTLVVVRWGHEFVIDG
jgi:hypothetical protein